MTPAAFLGGVQLLVVALAVALLRSSSSNRVGPTLATTGAASSGGDGKGGGAKQAFQVVGAGEVAVGGSGAAGVVLHAAGTRVLASV